MPDRVADREASGIPMLALSITAIGLLSGPRESLEQVLLAERAPAWQRAEVFSWLNTFMWGGYGIGTAVAGRLTGPAAGGTTALTGAAAIALLGAVLALTRCLRRPDPPAASRTGPQPAGLGESPGPGGQAVVPCLTPRPGGTVGG